MLSLEFSHDMAAEGGVGGKRKIRTEDVGIRVYCCFVNTVSLRVFLVWQIAVVTRQEKKGWVALETVLKHDAEQGSSGKARSRLPRLGDSACTSCTF